MDEGTNKKVKGGTIGKSLSASHTFHEMTFATSQKKQINLVTINFFEATAKPENNIEELFQNY